ncbi:MAG: hypothetical protein PF503_16285 [Desulfobacula sp.]|jgi:hypothetical protein|nr:hypothetical protein [Desulfobacula sp.]
MLNVRWIKTMWDVITNNGPIILTGAIGSIVATVIVLLTRLVFYKLKDHFPAHSLFGGIVDSDSPCLVFTLRLTDMKQEGKFLSPLPQYAVASSQPKFEPRQLTPWVTSTSETQSVAHILNVLGRVGRTDNIELVYVDQTFDRWDAPMFILGGSWKARRSFETCNPIFSFRNGVFILEPTEESYQPKTSDHDIGILQKMINPTTSLPVWVAMGWRGAGTVAATYALSRWWKEIGILYGGRDFGILLGMNDRDGWQQCSIVRMYPEPKFYKKLLHPVAWKKVSKAISGASVIKDNKQKNRTKDSTRWLRAGFFTTV